MIPFIAGIASVFGALMGVAYWMIPVWSWLYNPNDHIGALILRGVLAPTVAAWIIAEVVQVLSPRRNFDRRLRLRVRPFIGGVVAGLIGAAFGSFALALVEGETYEFLVLAGSGALGAVMPLVFMRRVLKGHCIHCGYDLRGQPGPGSAGSGLCPECGTPSWSRAALPHPADGHAQIASPHLSADLHCL
jgi:hypothetical protein